MDEEEEEEEDEEEKEKETDDEEKEDDVDSRRQNHSQYHQYQQQHLGQPIRAMSAGALSILRSKMQQQQQQHLSTSKATSQVEHLASSLRRAVQETNALTEETSSIPQKMTKLHLQQYNNINTGDEVEEEDGGNVEDPQAMATAAVALLKEKTTMKKKRRDYTKTFTPTSLRGGAIPSLSIRKHVEAKLSPRSALSSFGVPTAARKEKKAVVGSGYGQQRVRAQVEAL
jgi:hypothetical protein